MLKKEKGPSRTRLIDSAKSSPGGTISRNGNYKEVGPFLMRSGGRKSVMENFNFSTPRKPRTP